MWIVVYQKRLTNFENLIQPKDFINVLNFKSSGSTLLESSVLKLFGVRLSSVWLKFQVLSGKKSAILTNAEAVLLHSNKQDRSGIKWNQQNQLKTNSLTTQDIRMRSKNFFLKY